MSLSAFRVRLKLNLRTRSPCLERVRFAQAYSFKYSPRPGTPAAGLEQIPEETKIARLSRLQDIIAQHQTAPVSSPATTGADSPASRSGRARQPDRCLVMDRRPSPVGCVANATLVMPARRRASRVLITRRWGTAPSAWITARNSGSPPAPPRLALQRAIVLHRLAVDPVGPAAGNADREDHLHLLGPGRPRQIQGHRRRHQDLRCDDEDHQQHQHDVHQRRDVDALDDRPGAEDIAAGHGQATRPERHRPPTSSPPVVTSRPPASAPAIQRVASASR